MRKFNLPILITVLNFLPLFAEDDPFTPYFGRYEFVENGSKAAPQYSVLRFEKGMGISGSVNSLSLSFSSDGGAFTSEEIDFEHPQRRFIPGFGFVLNSYTWELTDDGVLITATQVKERALFNFWNLRNAQRTFLFSGVEQGQPTLTLSEFSFQWPFRKRVRQGTCVFELRAN